MWMIGLKCDGCEEILGACEVPREDYWSPFDELDQIERVEGHAEGQGWGRVDVPDELDGWLCPACRGTQEGGPRTGLKGEWPMTDEQRAFFAE
jgi:hypothetical protein